MVDGNFMRVTTRSVKEILLRACNSEVEVLPRINHHASSFNWKSITKTRLKTHEFQTWPKNNTTNDIPLENEGWKLLKLFCGWVSPTECWDWERCHCRHPFLVSWVSLEYGESFVDPEEWVTRATWSTILIHLLIKRLIWVIFYLKKKT